MSVVQASPEAIEQAARLIRAGRLVAFPTETVYGLGADATQPRAVAQIFEAKGRPRFNPLIVHVASLAAVERIAELGRAAGRLAERFWPGPMTLVLRARPGNGIADLVTAGLDTIAVRLPDHPVARALLEAADRPVAAPSANRSGRLSPTTAQHVASDLGDAPAMILDGGPCVHGLESTILDATSKRIVMLRPGAVTADDIEAVLGAPPERSAGVAQRPSAPGQLASHYAPRAQLRLEAKNVMPGEALLAFGPEVPVHDGAMFNLSPTGDVVEAAANLFAGLRALDATSPKSIAVMPIPARGLGEAINERLQRGAAPRDGEEDER
ncbi:MAG: L-threonylcarbamoyladenylate synthase [Hyphomicrobiaceae bacterium]